MKILFKYLVIIFSIICLSQTSLFAQLNNNYKDKYVQVILKNGRSFDGKVVNQTEEKITLEINVGNISFYKKDIEQINIKEKEEQEKPPLTGGHSSYKSNGSGEGIGITYDQAMHNLTETFPVMEESIRDDGTKIYVGTSGLASIEIQGEKENIDGADLTLFFAKDAFVFSLVNIVTKLTFINNFFPSQAEIVNNWIKETYTLSSHGDQKKIFDGKIVEIICNREIGILYILIRKPYVPTKNKTVGMSDEQTKASQEEIIFDLNEGTLEGALGQFKVSEFIDQKSVTEIVGEKPNGFDIVLGMKYLEKGIFIHLCQISDIDKRTLICCLGINYQEFGGMKKFRGKIIPQLSDNETKDTIVEKFGKPDRVVQPIFAAGEEDFNYKTKYGELTFAFGKKGDLWVISMSMKTSKSPPDWAVMMGSEIVNSKETESLWGYIGGTPPYQINIDNNRFDKIVFGPDDKIELFTRTGEVYNGRISNSRVNKGRSADAGEWGNFWFEADVDLRNVIKVLITFNNNTRMMKFTPIIKK